MTLDPPKFPARSHKFRTHNTLALGYNGMMAEFRVSSGGMMSNLDIGASLSLGLLGRHEGRQARVLCLPFGNMIRKANNT